MEAKRLEIPIISHCEDLDLTNQRVAHEGIARLLQVPGISYLSEEIIIARDILMAERINTFHLHIAHVSTGGSVIIIKEAKKRGLVSLSAETAPHYFALTQKAVQKFGSNANKMNPPLHTEEDRQAIMEGLADGNIDVIATDHASHTPEKKQKGLISAPFGIIGLETQPCP